MLETQLQQTYEKVEQANSHVPILLPLIMGLVLGTGVGIAVGVQR